MTIERIRVATGNQHKLEEFRAMIAPLGIVVLGKEDLDLPEVQETGSTFAENAALKARALHQAVGGFVLADDSGIAVDALEGAPGIYSARYNPAPREGESQDAANRRKLFEALATTPPAARQARFVCALVLITPDGEERFVEASWEGWIAEDERGPNGFGYDPMFIPGATLEGPTSAELAPAEKDAVSHRGKALRALVPILQAMR